MIVGSAFSTKILRQFGFAGNYVTRLIFYLLALSYLIFKVEEPVEIKVILRKIFINRYAYIFLYYRFTAYP